MFNLHLTTLFPRKINRIQLERASLIDYGFELQDLLDQADGLRDGLTVEALEWLTIDPHNDATQRYVERISEKLDRLDAEIAAIETKFFFAQDLYFELEAVLS